MAFNPFHWFRKHQRAIFALVTIVIMFVFILNFGKGDAFEKMLYYVGAGKSRGPVVATLSGTKIHEFDLEKVVRQRKLANDYLFTTVWDAHPRVLSDLLQKDLKSEARDNPLMPLRTMALSAQRRSAHMLVFQLMQNPQQAINQLPLIQADLQELERLAGQPDFKDNADRLQVFQKLSAILGFQSWLLQISAREQFAGQMLQLYISRRIVPEPLYFGGGIKTVDERLDFVLWKQQADKLGINLTDADVAREIIHESAGHEVFDPDKVQLDREKTLVKFIKDRREPNLTIKDLVEGLREEFRVVMAQGTLVGYEPGVRSYRSLFGATGSPSVVTPDEFLNFFRENRTRLTVDLLPISVEQFIDKVKENPSESELLARYKLFKDKEASPFSRDPGFKESRRIVVEYVTASPDDPFYRHRARQMAQAGLLADPRWHARSCVTAGACMPLGAGPIGPVAAHLMPLLVDPLQSSYERYLEENPSISSPAANGVAPTVGVLVAPSMGAGPLPGLATWHATDRYHKLFIQGRQSLRVLLAHSDPQQLFATSALALATRPEGFTRRQMRRSLLASLESNLAGEMLRNNFETIRTELAKVRTDPKKAEEYVARAVKEYGLRRHAMPRAMSGQVMLDRLTHKEDVGLNELKEAAQKRALNMQVRDFVVQLFGTQGTYEPQPLQGFIPQKEEFLFWRKEELPPQQPKSFAEVRDKVVRAWKLERARQMARQKADDLAAQINKHTWTDKEAETFLDSHQVDAGPLGKPFKLEEVSQLVRAREIHMRGGERYRAYQVPEDKVNRLAYPPADMVKQFLLLERPGEATVFADQPARTYYVTVLLKREEPSVQEFGVIYAQTPRFDTLYLSFTTQRMEEYQQKVVEQLRREAGKVDKEGRFEVPEDIRKRDTSRTSETEE